jgi:hypothetical protein
MRYSARAGEGGNAALDSINASNVTRVSRAPMAITKARAAIGRLFYQRCFYLFLVLLALIVGVPFIEPTRLGRIVVNPVGNARRHRCRRRSRDARCCRSSSRSCWPSRRRFSTGAG